MNVVKANAKLIVATHGDMQRNCVKGARMKEPRGIDLLKTLIELLADQESVTIEYVIEQHGEVLKGKTR